MQNNYPLSAALVLVPPAPLTLFTSETYARSPLELLAAILNFIREDGVSAGDAALLSGLEAETFLDWLRDTPAAVQLVQRARTAYQNDLLREIAEIADDPEAPNWEAQAFLLTIPKEERAAAAQAGDSSAHGAPMLVILTEENLADLQRRRMAALACTAFQA